MIKRFGNGNFLLNIGQNDRNFPKLWRLPDPHQFSYLGVDISWPWLEFPCQILSRSDTVEASREASRLLLRIKYSRRFQRKEAAGGDWACDPLNAGVLLTERPVILPARSPSGASRMSPVFVLDAQTCWGTACSSVLNVSLTVRVPVFVSRCSGCVEWTVSA